MIIFVKLKQLTMKTKAMYYLITGVLLTGQTVSFLFFIWSMIQAHFQGGWFFVASIFVSITAAIGFYVGNRLYKKSYFNIIASLYDQDIYKSLNRRQKRAFDRGTEKRKHKSGNYSKPKY